MVLKEGEIGAHIKSGIKTMTTQKARTEKRYQANLEQWNLIIAANFTTDEAKDIAIRDKIRDIEAIVRNTNATTQELWPGINVKSDKDAAAYEYLYEFDINGRKPRRGLPVEKLSDKKKKATYRELRRKQRATALLQGITDENAQKIFNPINHDDWKLLRKNMTDDELVKLLLNKSSKRTGSIKELVSQYKADERKAVDQNETAVSGTEQRPNTAYKEAVKSISSTILQATLPQKELWVEDKTNKKVHHYIRSSTLDEPFDDDEEENNEESIGDKTDEQVDEDSGFMEGDFMDGDSLFI